MNQPKFILSNEVTEKIFLSIQEGLVVCNSEDRIQIINGTALKIFGFTPEMEIVGKPIERLFTNAESAFDFLKFLEKEKQLNQQEIILGKHGDEIVCSLSASIIQDSIAGDLLKIIVIRDVTEREETERKLQEYAARLEKSNKELDQFAYIVSHDLKAPLRAIMNLSQWLQEDLEPTLSDDSKKNLDMLKNRTFRMEALITGILEYSKVGRSKIQAELVDVSVLISDVLESLIPPKHIKIETSKMPLLMAPKIMLFQIFSNLVGNAIKYNDKEQGLIKIHTQDLEDCYEFTIEDNGPGISKEFHEKVFAIFQTLQSRDKKESTGVGLTIVKKIVEEQGGKIWIESEEGSGTKFIFQWPKNNDSNKIL
jgi:PAS domain S-box-containing protein